MQPTGVIGSLRPWCTDSSCILGRRRERSQPFLDRHLVSSLNESDIALWTQPNHEMISWAAALQRAGYKTGILSNIGDAMEAGFWPASIGCKTSTITLFRTVCVSRSRTLAFTPCR